MRSRHRRIEPAMFTGRGLASIAIALAAAAVLSGGVLAQSDVRPPWQSQTAPLETAEIRIGDQTLTVELAQTSESRGRGLGYREGLAPGTGMLFVFPGSQERSFWMKGMRFCLDIIWIEAGEIVGAAESVCPEPAGTADTELPSYHSGAPVQFVLEVPAGWMDEHGFGSGTPVEIPREVTAGD